MISGRSVNDGWRHSAMPLVRHQNRRNEMFVRQNKWRTIEKIPLHHIHAGEFVEHAVFLPIIFASIEWISSIFLFVGLRERFAAATFVQRMRTQYLHIFRENVEFSTPRNWLVGWSAKGDARKSTSGAAWKVGCKPRTLFTSTNLSLIVSIISETEYCHKITYPQAVAGYRFRGNS